MGGHPARSAGAPAGARDAARGDAALPPLAPPIACMRCSIRGVPRPTPDRGLRAREPCRKPALPWRSPSPISISTCRTPPSRSGPRKPRDSARLLVVPAGRAFDERVVRDLPDLLEPGDALVFNDTRVIPAELTGERSREGSSVRVTANLHKRAAPTPGGPSPGGQRSGPAIPCASAPISPPWSTRRTPTARSCSVSTGRAPRSTRAVVRVGRTPLPP